MESSERAVTIRQPATANLMLDSNDLTKGNASDFSIQRNQSILNGFFTRIATSEVVLEWNIPNGEFLSNTSLTITYGANPAIVYTPNPKLFYTVESMLDEIKELVNTVLGAVDVDVGPLPLIDAGPPVVTGGSGTYIYSVDNTTPLVITGTLAVPLGIEPVGAFNWIYQVQNPDLRAFRYLDFVSSQLTYNQELKDASTKEFVRDVLCRWYMVYDNPPSLDAYGFPILMGYTPFFLRRIFSPPKQIRWSPQQVLGNISFQVYTDFNNLLLDEVVTVPTNFNWLMTLQVSEN